MQSGIGQGAPPTETGVLALADIDPKHVEKVLRLTRWSIKGPSGAAELLGMKPTALFSLMKRHGISRPIDRSV